MSTFRDWLLTIASALGDDEPKHEFTRFTVVNLVAAYNDAMTLAYKFRPDKFSKYETIELRTGRYQDVHCCCAQVLGVMDQVTENGDTLKRLDGGRKTTTKTGRHWNKPSCLYPNDKAPGGFLLENAILDPDMPGTFTVDPAVPPDAQVFVRVRCVSPPCALTEADQNQSFDNHSELSVAAWHYVLARMLTGDRFAQSGNAGMDFHYRMFWNILGVVEKQDEKYNAPEKAPVT